MADLEVSKALAYVVVKPGALQITKALAYVVVKIGDSLRRVQVFIYQ